MKKREIIRKINEKAKEKGLPKVQIHGDGKHDKLILSNLRIPIPRKREISSGTYESIMKSFEQIFGEDWWRDGSK